MKKAEIIYDELSKLGLNSSHKIKINEIRNKDFVIGESKENIKESDFRLKSKDGRIYTYGKMIKRDV